MATTGAIIAIIGTASSIDESKRQAREVGRQKVASNVIEFSKRARERRAALKERRIRTAQLAVSAEATGVRGSSGELGTEAALATTFAVNVGFGNQLQAGRDVIGASQVRAARSSVRGATDSSLASTGFNIFQNEGGFKSLFS